ncbi:tripartite tricarboxylate transporter substrate binding protein [Jannaschia seohaensis]|uniref:Tripartite-type tricarboxylate transporter receptor subunit TctC n=1 Tax=Jannaschia seohaensis TaxID=475081 RepID=A0A2Y9AQF1_9RHOB|nr:tripartite tricarboxylate transporter substrate binding protein [Jannaschia seohaensis]PWJ20601.1 tripartite-type tricarboxylate transporter receptor subunit TctC [Jannaschia seohaensis]SSA44697.1 Tripartite-type tricarboxylate transporter, receptor component TctC [Jannaschia seohaensis]
MIKHLVKGALALALTAGLAHADEYPSESITLIVPYSPGGNGDITSRFIADKASDIMGVNFVVENRAGGGAFIGINSCANADPDGYTICFISTSPITVRPHVIEAPYDPMTDLTYLGQFMLSKQPVIVRDDGKFNSIDDVIAFAKENPGQLRWSAAVPRGGPHLATEAMFRAEDAVTTFLPSKGGAVELANLLSGTIDLAVISDYGPALDNGEIKILAETSPGRNPQAPDAPTLSELGYPLELASFFALAAPAGLSEEVIATWDDTMKQITDSEEFKTLMDRIKGQGAYLNSADFTARVRADFEAMGEATQTYGLAN